MRGFLMTTALVLSVSGCGVVYRSSAVLPNTGDGSKVRVLPVTAETVIQANRSPYTPKTLPAIFSMTAGTGSGLRGAGAIPEPPSVAETRPSALALRRPPAVNPGPYQIGVGDVVLLSTRSTGSTVEELSGLLAAQNSRQGYTVQDDGSINIPNVGRVRIAGQTIEDAEAELFQRLVENQIDPTFSLEIAEFNSKRVSIGGAVSKPSVLPVTLVPLYLDEALAAAGSITVEDLDFASVRIYRNETLYQIPLNDLFSDSGLKRTRLVDGDVVFVDTEYELSQAESYFEQQIKVFEIRQSARSLALSQLQTEVSLQRGQLDEARTNYQKRQDLGADAQDYVYLAGEVGTQSRFALPFERKANLADALYDKGAGIATQTGDITQIYVLRAAVDQREFGAVTAWHLNTRNAANLALATRFELRPNDVIFVSEQPVTRWNRTMSQIIPSLLTTGAALANN